MGKSRLETHNVQIKREAHAGCFSAKLEIVVACSQKIGSTSLSCFHVGKPSRACPELQGWRRALAAHIIAALSAPAGTGSRSWHRSLLGEAQLCRTNQLNSPQKSWRRQYTSSASLSVRISLGCLIKTRGAHTGTIVRYRLVRWGRFALAPMC